jgi:hypothetical protein
MMAEWFGWFEDACFILSLESVCIYCIMEELDRLGAEYVWPDRRRYVVILLRKASFLVLYLCVKSAYRQ